MSTIYPRQPRIDSASVDINFFLLFARRDLRLEIKLDAAEDLGADVVEGHGKRSGYAAQDSRQQRGLREHGTEHIGRDDDIPELEDVIEQDEQGDGDGRCGGRRRWRRF